MMGKWGILHYYSMLTLRSCPGHRPELPVLPPLSQKLPPGDLGVFFSNLVAVASLRHPELMGPVPLVPQ